MRARKIAANLLNILLAAALLLAASPMAFASGATARIPVKQGFKTNRYWVDDSFQYVLEAVSENAPMPEGSRDGKYIFTMEGNTTRQLLIEGDAYVSAEYRIYPVLGEKKAYYTYDSSEYKVFLTFYVDDEGEVAFALTIENKKGEKAESAHFSHSYYRPSSGYSPRTGDDSGIGMYTLLMLASGLMLILIILLGRKRKEEPDDEQPESNEE